MYGCKFHCELAVILCLIASKGRIDELHINTKNKAISTATADREMIHI